METGRFDMVCEWRRGGKSEKGAFTVHPQFLLARLETFARVDRCFRYIATELSSNS